MINRRILAGLLVTSSLLLTACGGKADNTSTTPKPDNEITILRTDDIDGWDPDGAKLVATWVTLPNVLEGLVRVGADGVTIEPAIAASWTFDAAAPSYTFTIREDVTFSDGTPLTAEDVAFSVRQWATGKRLGVYFSDIKDATAADPHTVTVTLARPSTFVLDFLASGIAPVIPKDYGGKTREEFYKAPIGAGPFVIETYSPGIKTVLVRNENYYGEKAPLERVVYKIVSDPSQQLAQFKSGDADIIETIDPVLAQQVDEAQRITVNPASRNVDIVFNFNSPLGQDLSFRQAVNFAINRDRLVTMAYEGLATPAEGIMPPGTIGSVGCGCDTYRYDLEAANAALTNSTYKGETLRLVTQTTSGDSPQVELIKADLEAIGVQVAVEQYDIQVLLQKVASGEYDVGIGTYNNVSPTAGDLFFYFYVTKFFNTGAPVDQVLASFLEFAAATEADSKGDAVRGLEEWAAANLPIVPVLSTAIVVPVNSRVHGLTMRPYNRYYLDEISVG